MIKIALLTVVALAGLTVSGSSQVRVESRIGGVSQGSVRVVRPAIPVLRTGRRPVARSAPRVTRIREVVRYDRPRYRTVQRRVWVPGYYEVVPVPARYGWTIGVFGVRVWGVIEPSCRRQVWRPGYWTYRVERIGYRR